MYHQAWNNQSNERYNSHYIELRVTREMQSAEEATDARNKAAHLNDSVSDDEPRDCCTHSEA